MPCCFFGMKMYNNNNISPYHRTKKIVQVSDNMRVNKCIFCVNYPFKSQPFLIRSVLQTLCARVSGAGQLKVLKGNKSVRTDNIVPGNTFKTNDPVNTHVQLKL